jgi:hypothetical protein
MAPIDSESLANFDKTVQIEEIAKECFCPHTLRVKLEVSGGFSPVTFPPGILDVANLMFAQPHLATRFQPYPLQPSTMNFQPDLRI